VLRTVSGETRAMPEANWASLPAIVQLMILPVVSSPMTRPLPMPRVVKSACGQVLLP
jgi:hypothetical protein